MRTLIAIFIVLLILGLLPTWPYSRTWGFGPSGLTVVLAVLLAVLLRSGAD